MEPIAYVTPLWHGVETTRSLALGIETTWAPGMHYLVMLAYLVVGAAIADRFYHKKLVV